MPKRKEPELDPKEQFKRFQETAKDLEIGDKERERVERSFGDLAKAPNRNTRTASRRTER
jgi:hypothetical protein